VQSYLENFRHTCCTGSPWSTRRSECRSCALTGRALPHNSDRRNRSIASGPLRLSSLPQT